MIDRFYPETYGGVSGGAQDCAGAMTQAFAAITAAGAGILDVSRGIYRIDSPVIMSPVDNLAVVGSGSSSGFLVTSAYTGASLSTALTTNTTGGLGASTTVSSIAGEGTSGVAVASPIFAVGDVVKIAFGGPPKWGAQYNEVASTGGNAVFFVRPLPFTVVAGTVIQKVTMRRGLRLAGFSVRAQDQTVEHTGLHVSFERDALLNDLYAEGQGSYVPQQNRGGGFSISEGLNNRFTNLETRKAGSNGQNAIAFVYQTGLQALNIRSEQGAFGIGLTYCADGQMSGLQSHRDTARAIKLFGTHHMSLSNVNSGAAAHVGFGFSEGSSNNLVVGLDIRGIQGGQNQGLWFNGDSNLNNTVLGCKIRITPAGSVIIPQGDAHNYVQLVDHPTDTLFNAEPTSKIVVIA